MARNVEEVEKDIQAQESIKRRLENFKPRTEVGTKTKGEALVTTNSKLGELRTERDNILSEEEKASVERIMRGEQTEEEKKEEENASADQSRFLQALWSLEAGDNSIYSHAALCRIQNALRRCGEKNWFEWIKERKGQKLGFRSIGSQSEMIIQAVWQKMEKEEIGISIDIPKRLTIGDVLEDL